MSEWRKTFPWMAYILRTIWPEGPARRKRWLTLAVLLLLLVAVHAALTALLSARLSGAARHFTSRWGELDPAAHRPAPVEDGQNRARAVRAAAEVMVADDLRGGGRKALEDYAAGITTRISETERAGIRDGLRENGPALALLDVAGARPQSNWDLKYERGVEVDVPPLLRLMQLAKINAAAGRLALEDGRSDDAVAAARRGVAIASSLDGEPLLIVQLIRAAISGINARLMRLILSSADLTASQAAALDPASPGSAPREAMQRALIWETAAMSRFFAGSPGGDWAAGTPAAPLVQSRPLRTLLRPLLLEDGRVWVTTMDSRIAALDRPRHERGPAAEEPRRRFWNIISGLMFANLGDIADRADLWEARESLMRLAIAIERHRLDKGAVPATLEDLVPRYLEAVPRDPFTGEDFHYEAAGTSWRVRAGGEWSSLPSAVLHDPVLDWSRPAQPFGAPGSSARSRS